MDDINVKAELVASQGSSNPKVEAAEVPPDDPPATPPSDGLRISSVVSMAASLKSEVVLPDVVGSAVHAVVELEPDELPAPPSPPSVPGREGLDFSIGEWQDWRRKHGFRLPRTAEAEPPNPAPMAEHQAVVTDAVPNTRANLDPAALKAEREPSPEVVDLTEDAPSSPADAQPFLFNDEVLEEKPVDLGVLTVAPPPEADTPETDTLETDTPETKSVRSIVPTTENVSSVAGNSDPVSDEEGFRGFRDSDVARAKKRSARFADFLRKYDCERRHKSKGSKSSSSGGGNNVKRRWFDGCQYRCGFCGLTFSQTSMLRNIVGSILNFMHVTTSTQFK